MPVGWVIAKGSQSFRFFRGEAEFRPDMDGSDSTSDYDTLRTTEFAERDQSKRPSKSVGSR